MGPTLNDLKEGITRTFGVRVALAMTKHTVIRSQFCRHFCNLEKDIIFFRKSHVILNNKGFQKSMLYVENLAIAKCKTKNLFHDKVFKLIHIGKKQNFHLVRLQTFNLF